MILVILTGVLAVSNTATLGETNEQPRYARKAFGLFNPFGSSDRATASTAHKTFEGAVDSYGRPIVSTAHKTIDDIGSGIASIFGIGGSKKEIKTGTETTVVTGIDLRNIQFPLYIQGFANQYDIGKYYEGFAKGHGISVEKYGIIVRTHDGYLYKGDDGKVYIIKFIIDENEFREKRGSSPNPFSIPDEILRVIREITKNRDSETSLRFPLFIQDLSSEYDSRTYYYGLAKGRGISIGQYGVIVKVDGGYLYKGGDEKIYIVKYIRNEYELNEKGSNLPTQFLIPSEILKVLKEITDKEAKDVLSLAKTVIDFPVYVQDFANDFEIKLYFYGLAKGSGISIGPKGALVKIYGGYLYKGEDGKIYIVNYITDESEFKRKEGTLGIQFSTPSEILNFLKEKEAAGDSGIVQTNIQFPIYIQDFASKFEIKKYYYGLARGSGISKGQNGVVIKTNEGYLYKGDDGKIYIVRYITDEKQLKEKGSTLENQFSIPGETMKVIKEITENEAANNSIIAELNIIFPVYIQDFANAYDIYKYNEGLAKGSGIATSQYKIIIKTDGGYLYEGDDFKIYIVKYVIDENKLTETESSLDTQFLVPDDILEELAQINIQFPIYVQDIASNYDKIKYFYGLATGSGIPLGQKGVIIKTNEGYLYKGDDEKIYIVRYIINENELKEKASNLPTRFSIPAEILRVLKGSTEKETAGNSGIVQTKIKFPLYIQDYASKLDVKKYYYGLATGIGMSFGHKRIVIKTNGGYLYKGDDDKIYIVRYIINENELKEKSSTFENLFSIPGETLTVLKEIAGKEATGDTSMAQINIQFPVYIQDFASAYEVQIYYQGLSKGSGISFGQNKIIIKTYDGYLYKGDDGKIYIVKYIIDENEFVEEGSTLETQFKIPDEVLEKLREINVQFPVYIQDLASEDDKKIYFYGIATGRIISVGGKGFIIKTDGGYLYKGNDGKIYIVRYIVNETEYKEKAGTLLHKFSIQSDILKVLKEYVEKEGIGNFGKDPISIQYPVYIQDYASKFEIIKYYYGLARGSGISIGQKGVVIKTNEGYLYKGDDGKIYIVRYITDEKELKEKGSTLENQFSIPGETMKIIKEITEKEAANNSIIAELNIIFPVYIQDFANEYDIYKYNEGLAKGSGIATSQYKIIIKTDGGYLYEGDDFKIYIVKYVIDENKLRETESSLDTQFLVPDDILEELAQINIQFPVYVQDIASEYDKIKYFYGLATGSGIPLGQKGVIIKTNEGYLYKGDDEKIYIVRYIVNENELKERASNLPTRFSIPGEVLRVLKDSTEKETTGNSGIVQTKIKFPLYIQDYASKLDVRKYYYGLATGIGISFGHKRIVIKTNGGYLYKGNNDKIYIVRYISNENELKEKSSTFENQFSISEETLTVLKEIAGKETTGDTSMAQINIQFPLYIQDFASAYEVQIYYQGLSKGSGISYGQNKIIIKTYDGYLYKGDDGKIYIVKYIIDENEFVEGGSTLETQFKIPDEVLERLREINVQFPVYIQDLASEYDKKIYFYGIATGRNISVDGKGFIVKTDGGYLYKGNDGKIYIVRYIVNETEYKEKAGTLLHKFSIQSDVLKVLKEYVEKEGIGNFGKAPITIQYPVYIQDYASKFEIIKYYYGLARGSGISIGQKGVVIKTNEGYLYKGDDGKIYIVKYITDEKELKEKGSTLENQFSIPGETMKIIKEITEKEAANNSIIAELNIIFPVYIQDFANEYDIYKYNEGLAKGSGIATSQYKIIIKTDGGYLYEGDDFKIYIVKYVIDENKLRETESSLDTQFLVPDDILEELAQINIKFPVYVQDIASEYDKIKYFYGLATGSGIPLGQKGVIIKTNEGYLYKGDDEKIYFVRYIVNENELKEKASNLPTRFSIPGEILRVLKDSTEKETTGNSGIVQTKIKFPLYIQDYASKLDVKKYYYGLATGIGISFGHKRIVIKTNGGYLYKGDDDKIYIVRYISNENELKEKSSTFENQFSISEETLTVLKEIAGKETMGDTSMAQINIQFPLYIQDFASAYEVEIYYQGLSKGSGISYGQNKIVIKTYDGYLYKGDDGKIYIVKYIIDENEFVEEGSTLEIQFKIPDEVLERLREINVQFPVYIQDLASEYDKKIYFYGIATGRIISVGGKGFIVKTDGGYLYKGDDGEIYIVKYIVNETEYKEKAGSLLHKFSIQSDILKVLKENTEKDGIGNFGKAPITIQYPVYIQDFASDLDIGKYYEGLSKGNGISIGQKVIIIKTNGGFLCKGDDGKIYIIRYIIDEKEFKEKASTLETQFSIPDEILTGVKDINAKESNVNTETDKEQKVVASEPDKKKYFDSIAKGNFVSISIYGQKGIGVETDGGYLYRGDDGKIYFIKYVTIKNEIKYQGGYSQVQNSIPDEIISAIVQIVSKDGTVSTTAFYTQELANESYMKEYIDGLAKGDAIIGQKFAIVRTKGGFLYKGADGYIYIVKYTTDQNEFKSQQSQYAGKETVIHVNNEKSSQSSTYGSTAEYHERNRSPTRYNAK